MTQDKTLLPFRAERMTFRGYPHVVIHYRGRNLLGQETELSLPAAVLDLSVDDPRLVRDNLGTAILQTLELFWKMERQLEGLMKEREDWEGRTRAAEARGVEMENRIKGYQGQIAKLQNAKK